MSLRLLAVHRILIQVFIVFSAFFAYHQLTRWRASDSTVELACGIGSIVIVLGGVVYLLTARHLRR